MRAEERRGFSEFVAARSDSLIRLAYVLTGDQHSAEDLLQTALAKTASRWSRIRTNPEAYVRRVMYHEQVGRWRSPWWGRENVVEAPPEQPSADATAQVDERLALEAAMRAEPVNPQAAVARALRGSVRRSRTRWALSVAAVAVGCVAVVGVVSGEGGGEGADVARIVNPVQVSVLPDNNTPEQLQVVKDCMPKGGPTHNMDNERRVPKHGVTADFRWLGEVRDERGMTVFVGSAKGYVICTPAIPDVLYADDPVFTYWGGEPPGRLDFTGAITVDNYVVQATGAVNPSEYSPFLVVVGRVAPEVAKVEIVWQEGKRTEVTPVNGYFIGRLPTHWVQENDNTQRLFHPEISRVTALDADGAVLGELKDVKRGTMGAIDENE